MGFRRSRSQELRELFLLDPDTIYLNHGSFGACPRPVFESYQRWQRVLERQPVSFFRKAPELLRTAREALAAYVKADADDLVFVPNITAAINIIARSLRLEPDDQVLATDLEYGAMDFAWQYACSLRGAAYVRQNVPLPVSNAQAVVDAVWSSVTEHTHVLFMSHYTSSTAIRLPIEGLISRARQRGIITVIDGAHVLGHLDLDLASLGADFYGANCHKWLMAPKGSAFLYARRPMQELLQPLIVSWGHGRRRNGESRFAAEQEHWGTRDLAAFLAVPDAIAFQQGLPWDEVRDDCHALLCEARRRVAEMSGQAPICPESPDWFRQMALLPLPGHDLPRLKDVLLDHYGIEIPCMDGRIPGLRLSIQGYNSARDVEALLGALDEQLALRS